MKIMNEKLMIYDVLVDDGPKTDFFVFHTPKIIILVKVTDLLKSHFQ